MIGDIVLRSLRTRSHITPVEQLINGCSGSRMPEIAPERLTARIALRAAEVCPTGAITTEQKHDAFVLRLDYGKCIGCGRCMDAGEGAIRPAQRFSTCGVSRMDLVRTWQGGVTDEKDLPITQRETRDRIFNLMGRALNVRQLDSGSCNGCEAEITALTNPYYDLERFGIHFVASPKHADMLLVTGPITRNMAEAVRKTYEAVPAPKLVVAVGACGCSGGIFACRENREIVGAVDVVLPVDGYIPGCPPSPAMLVTGILKVLQRAGMKQSQSADAHHKMAIAK